MLLLKNKLFIIILCFFTCLSVKGFEVRNSFNSDCCPEIHWSYSKSSLFVDIPAHLGYYAFYPAGFIVLCPLSLLNIGSPFFFRNAIMQTKMLTHETFAHVGYFIAGSPFFVLETLFVSPFREKPEAVSRPVENKVKSNDIKREYVTDGIDKNDKPVNTNGIIDNVIVAPVNASLEHVRELNKCCHMYFIMNKRWPASFKELNEWVKKNKPAIRLKEECFKEVHFTSGTDNRLNINYIYESEKQSIEGEVNLPPPSTDSGVTIPD